MTNKKSKIPYFFFIFFAIFITVDIAFIYISKKTWRGTVTEDSYEKGRKYNRTILANKKQKELNWSGDISQKFIENQKSLLIFSLKDDAGQFIKNANIKLKLVRPTQTGFDFEDKLFFNKFNNKYQKEVNFPLKGLWKIEVQAFVGDKIFQYVQRIVID